MLIDKRNKDVRCLYMIGMELIGEFVAEDDLTITLKNVLAFRVQTVPNPNDPMNPAAASYSVRLMPPTLFAEQQKEGLEQIVITKAQIMFPYEPSADIYKQYCDSISPLVGV